MLLLVLIRRDNVMRHRSVWRGRTTSPCCNCNCLLVALLFICSTPVHRLRVHMEGQQLRHDPNPVYVGVTLDRTLSYRQHLRKAAGKLQSRNNLLTKLAGSSRSANANTLRSSVLALCYSVAEYCCPVWQRSTLVFL